QGPPARRRRRGGSRRGPRRSSAWPATPRTAARPAPAPWGRPSDARPARGASLGRSNEAGRRERDDPLHRETVVVAVGDEVLKAAAAAPVGLGVVGGGAGRRLHVPADDELADLGAVAEGVVGLHLEGAPEHEPELAVGLGE